jgi:hypothetical protein
VGYVDPWPDVFYGQVYIGWPVGSRIYIDGVFIGVAPLYIPRHYHGRHVITCYDGPRLIRRHVFHFYPKRYYYIHHHHHHHGAYRKARPDVHDHWRFEKSGKGKRRYEIFERKKIGDYDDEGTYRGDVTTTSKSNVSSRNDNFIIKSEKRKSSGVSVAQPRSTDVSKRSQVTKNTNSNPTPRGDDFIIKNEKRKSGSVSVAQPRPAKAAKAEAKRVENKSTIKSSKRQQGFIVSQEKPAGRSAKARATHVETREVTTKARAAERDNGSAQQVERSEKRTTIKSKGRSSKSSPAQIQSENGQGKGKANVRSSEAKNSKGKDRSAKRVKGGRG